jgi:cell division protease FtsH
MRFVTEAGLATSRKGATMMKVLLWVVLGFVVILFALAAFTIFQSPGTRTISRSYSYSAFVTVVDDGKVEEVAFRGANITGLFKDGSRFDTLVPHAQLIPALTDRLLAAKVGVVARPENDPSETPWYVSLVVSWLPFLIYVGSLWLFMGRPIMALTRKLDAYIKATQNAAGGNPA